MFGIWIPTAEKTVNHKLNFTLRWILDYILSHRLFQILRKQKHKKTKKEEKKTKKEENEDMGRKRKKVKEVLNGKGRKYHQTPLGYSLILYCFFSHSLNTPKITCTDKKGFLSKEGK